MAVKDIKENKLFFSSKKFNREGYFLEYKPPLPEYRFATIDITFLHERTDLEVAAILEKETTEFVLLYSMPVMTSAFDNTDSLIDLRSVKNESHVTGFINSKKGLPELHWRLLKDNEIPDTALNKDYLINIYKDFDKKTTADLEREAGERRRGLKLFSNLVLVWVVLIPFVILVLEFLMPEWLALIFLIFGLIKVSIKGLKMKGLMKKTKNETQREEEDLRKRHYYYHCERNPDGFLMLKAENFRRDIKDKVMAEAARVAAQEQA